MKLFIIALLLLVAFAAALGDAYEPNISKAPITGEAITGEATSQQFSLSIVVSTPPTVVLHSPKNYTYFTNTSLLLNFSVFGAASIWYNIDQGANITITGSKLFNASAGSHKLILYANGSDGATSVRNATFNVNNTRFAIMSPFTPVDAGGNATAGNSTNFFHYGFEELQNLSNIAFEHIQNGKIFFPGMINVTNDAHPEDGIIDLDSHIHISFNKIDINVTELPNFNKSATLYLYGLPFANPYILRSNEPCPNSVCNIESYQGGVLIFNVTGFSSYSAAETPVPAALAGGGGGGGKTLPTKKFFNITPERLSISLKQGETKREKLILAQGAERKVLDLSVSGPIREYIKTEEQHFVLPANTPKIIILDFLAPMETKPGIYIGKVLLRDEEGNTYSVPVAINIQPQKPLFDVSASILRDFSTVAPGQETVAEIAIYNLGEIRRIDSFVDYQISDDEGRVLLESGETIAVETQTSFIRRFAIPETAPPGSYILQVKVRYNEDIALASAWFSVEEEEKPARNFAPYLLVIIIVLVAIIISAGILALLKRRHTRK